MSLRVFEVKWVSGILVVLGCGLELRGFLVRFLVGAWEFAYFNDAQFVSWPHRPNGYVFGIGLSSPGGKAVGGANLTSHVYLVSRLRITEAMPLLPLVSSWCLQEKITFTFKEEEITEGWGNLHEGELRCFTLRNTHVRNISWSILRHRHCFRWNPALVCVTWLPEPVAFGGLDLSASGMGPLVYRPNNVCWNVWILGVFMLFEFVSRVGLSGPIVLSFLFFSTVIICVLSLMIGEKYRTTCSI